ncbi:hypothetical protein N7540_008792 [Penicillium herquei]|nr:hypothetical protein N7540_008792 [Penicillium herquei]
MKISCLWLGAAAASVIAAPAFAPHALKLHERRDSIPASWSEERRLDASTSLPVRIGLVQSNLEYGHELLMQMSNPASSQYRKHMTESEIHDLFAPGQERVDNVRSWLESSGIASHRISQSTNKQWIQFDADADELERLLHTEYYIYSHANTGRSHVACRKYHVPHSVSDDIDYITPGIALREVSNVIQSKNDIRKRAGDGIIPILSPLLISIEELLNNLGIFESIGDFYAQEDLNLFFSTFASKIPIGIHPTLKAIDGAKAPTTLANAGAESDLDFQISYPIIWPQNSILFQTDDMVYEDNYTFRGFLNTFLDAIDGSYCNETSPLDPSYPDPQPGGYKGSLQCGIYDPPNVISISYGSAEADLPIAYQRHQCNEFMKLGMRGVSVVVASGDSGVAGRGGDPTPSNCLGPNGKVFAPEFPASCPYMTAVGATYLPRGAKAQDHQEVAVSRFGSGGGFSNIYERPSWQSQAVTDYFAKANLTYPYYESVNDNSFGANGGIYNRIGRGYPDVSAVGDNVIIYNKGFPTSIGGTSASAPVFAAILTQINGERIAVGKPTNPGAFFDVTSGTNSGCGTSGFHAAAGWDPVTGLGTPNYPALLKVFMS